MGLFGMAEWEGGSRQDRDAAFGMTEGAGLSRQTGVCV